MNDTIVIGGALAQRPGVGGHTWQFLQYLLGFRRLGWDVLFLDHLEEGMCVDASGRPASIDDSVNLAYFLDVMRGFGLEGSFGLAVDGGSRWIGLSRARAVERTKNAACLVNVMGYVDDEEILAAAPLRVFLDTDPGFGQMWRALRLADVFAGHDAHVTIAENLGRPDCGIPTCGIDWIRWRQPVVLERWAPGPVADEGDWFTSVGAWRGPYGTIEFEGRTYGLRAHEFRRFVTLPRRTGRPFEIALDIHAAERPDLALLREHGWWLADPAVVARDPWIYREYVRNSRAEFNAAKNIYVDTRSGWFSERSICYLASGKPVLVQDTGLEGLLPVGEGLLTFSTLEEATNGVERIVGEYPVHAEAARAIAEECFDSDVVIPRLLAALGI